MLTLKVLITAVAIGSSAVLMNNATLNNTANVTQSFIQRNHIVKEDVKVVEIRHVPPVNVMINMDKTYDQCAREALEQRCQEINKMLDDLVTSNSCAA